jgi:hypothetical protein
MPDSLYEHDVLAWSEHQAGLLRRLGRGERVGDVDWANLAEEIEGVGLCELHAVESYLNLILLHLLKLHVWPDSEACRHWRVEIVGFQKNLKRQFSPSMRQRLDLADLYTDALDMVRAGDRDIRLPPENPFTLDDLRHGDVKTLLSRFAPSEADPGLDPQT